MKAIHNKGSKTLFKILTVFNTSKIQNESNSQHSIIKAKPDTTVFNTSKIQNESNSQHTLSIAI